MSDADVAELSDLSNAWMQAVQDRDGEALERLVHPQFRFTATHLDPEPMTRSQWMAAALEGYHIVSFSFLDAEVIVDGDTGIVHARYSQIANLGTHDLSHVFRLTDVWARSGSQWRVLARHSVILEA